MGGAERRVRWVACVGVDGAMVLPLLAAVAASHERPRAHGLAGRPAICAMRWVVRGLGPAGRALAWVPLLPQRCV